MKIYKLFKNDENNEKEFIFVKMNLKTPKITNKKS